MPLDKKGLYVSDILEKILDASTVRQITRNVTISLIGKLHPKLDSITEYIGGKCMGYPSIWFIQKALKLSDRQVENLLMKHYSSLFISLSTSIGDDLVDKDEDTHIGHLGLLYLLLMKGFSARKDPRVDDTIYQNGIAVMMDMLNSRIGSNIDTEKIGNKIGLFYRMICFELCTAVDDGHVNKPALLNLATKFGCWCSEVDDFMDIEKDIEAGQYFTRPVLSLINQGEIMKRAVLEKDYAVTNQMIDSPEFVDESIAGLVSRLQIIALDAHGNDFKSLANALFGLLPALPQNLREIRMAAKNIYVAKSIHGEVNYDVQLANLVL
jgi:hypothetical protein